MLKVYYCTNCKQTMYISRETDTTCRKCSVPMLKLNISYDKFGVLSEKERTALINKECMLADLVIIGTIVAGEGIVKEAIAVKNGKITYVGNGRDVQVMIGAKTKVIKPKGAVVPELEEGCIIGSLKEGKDADFTILDKNLLTTKPSQLYTAKVQQIFKKGSCIKK